jgi:hypothetical protein
LCGTASGQRKNRPVLLSCGNSKEKRAAPGIEANSAERDLVLPSSVRVQLVLAGDERKRLDAAQQRRTLSFRARPGTFLDSEFGTVPAFAGTKIA